MVRWRNSRGDVQRTKLSSRPTSPPDPDDPDLTLAEMFRLWPDSATVFLRHQMLCVGCPIAPFHTVIDACLEYGLDEAAFREELRAERAPGQAAAATPPGR